MTNFLKEFKDCYVCVDNNQLVIGNQYMERTWRLCEKLPVVQSVRDKVTGKEWVTDQQNIEWYNKPEDKNLSKYAFYKKDITEGQMQLLGADAEIDDDIGIGQTHLRITVKLAFNHFFADWIQLIYPGLPIMRSFLRVSVKPGVEMDKIERTADRNPEWPTDYYDCYPLAPLHCRWENVSFFDRTDVNDNLVQKRHGLLSRREGQLLQGNLLFNQDYMGQDGLLLIKEGPTPFAYQSSVRSDFTIRGYCLYTNGWGYELEEFQKAQTITTYGGALILWHGEMENAYEALNKYHRAIRIFVPRRDAQVMSNTWGDWHADACISEEFILAELEKAKILGIDFCQIDDGWEKGVTCNSVNAASFAAAQGKDFKWGESYYKADPEFWKPNLVRLPNGLAPLASFANDHDIRLGLWFSPDNANDYANWKRDIKVILELYRSHGIKAFKMDGITFRSKVAEENFTNVLRYVLKESNNEILFNIDTTAGKRTGFFGRVQYGSLFLENRFTDNFGDFPNYWPHMTLRNLWSLSRYVNPERLQIEFLNVYRNQELYGDDLLAPAKCGIEYAFAITMFSTPLAWLEMTGLGDEATEILKKVIPVYRRVQADLLSGFVQPVGNEPDGTQWTGFQSIKDKHTGYIEIIRELNQENAHTYKLVGLKNNLLKLEPILGYGKQTTIEVGRDGSACFELEKPFSYALYKYNV